MPDQPDQIIVISHDDAARAITALRVTADSYRRASRSRSNGGPSLAAHRAHLREEAAKMAETANRMMAAFA